MTSHANRKDLVLVVDDSPDSLGMINDTLDEAGFTGLVALEGSQALSITKSITPDIILMDALMPGMDGFEVCRRIKGQANLRHIPIIFMTGLSDKDSVLKGFEAGGVDYIQKPINGYNLIARIKVHLNNARLTQSARLALDASGQHTLTTTADGVFKWATPQALCLLEEIGLDEDYLKKNLQRKLGSLAKDKGYKEKKISLNQGASKIELKYVKENERGEKLFRILKADTNNESSVLQSAFDLTTRESEVLTWVAKGKSNSEIAIILSISTNTINAHLAQIFKKLDVENRTSAAIIAMNSIRDHS